MKKKAKGRISIVRRRNTVSMTDEVVIEIEDENTGVRIGEFEMTMENFASAITGLSGIPVEMEVWDNFSYVGGTRETKQVKVEYPHHINREERKKAAVEAMKSFEVDGWKGSLVDATNNHRITPIDCDTVAADVTFARFLDENGNPIK